MKSGSEAGPEEREVFTQGEGQPWYTFRIPSLIVSPGGALLAFCEARDLRTRGGDHARNDIVLKRSADGGRTWTPLQVVAADGDNSLNNPTAVVVGETGRVILMYQRYPSGFHTSPKPKAGLRGVEPGYEGERICRTFTRTSDDDGATWSARREITRSVKRAEATATLCGPGVGIQLRRGKREGRLVMPFYQFPRPNKVYAVFSDDLGETWSRGEPAADLAEGAGNENQMVELADGSVMVNSRRSGPGAARRKVAISQDGGETWSGLADDPTLIGPGCQGSILRYSDALDGRRSRILFCNPASETERKNGVVRVSYDEARAWPVGKSLKSAGIFCYSCLAVLPDRRIGALYEGAPSADVHITIIFSSFTLDWLTDAKEPASGGVCRPADHALP